MGGACWGRHRRVGEQVSKEPFMSEDVRIDVGIIGGSGLYEMEGLKVLDERKVETPFGEPSDPYVVGEVDGIRVAFLSRHGRGHRKMPTEINYRANLFG